MLSVTMLLSVAMVVVAQGVEEEIPMCGNTRTNVEGPQWECPKRVMCGVEYRTIHDWHNGTRCRNSSITIFCVCHRNKPCPVQNENHLFYVNDEHLQYLCEPRCDFDMCRENTTRATVLIHNSYDIYYMINCRCPGHNEPIATLEQSTTIYMTHHYKYLTFTWFKCDGDETLSFEDTVCEGSRPRRGRLGLLGEEEDSWA